MFSNYLKMAIRNMLRQQLYTIINIVGLAIGIACFILIGLWVQDEVSYDRYFKNADRIYRIANGLVTDGVNSPLAQADPRIADHIREEHAAIGTVVRIHNQPSLISIDNKSLHEPHTYYADTTFFSIFSYKLAQGETRSALHRKDAVILSAAIARKLFGNSSAIGRKIFVRNERARDQEIVRTVTGVLEERAGNSHFNPEIIVAKLRNMDQFEPTYIRFNKHDGPQTFKQKVWPQIYNKYFRAEYKQDEQDLTLILQPLTSIHLQSGLLWELEANGNLDTVYTFSVIALFILLIASINYTNLATARFIDRSREVSIRKVIGATKKQIILQFLTESLLLAFMGLVLALSIVEISLPYFSKLTGKDLSVKWMQPYTAVMLIAITTLVGLASGIYPAFFASSISPAKLLNRDERAGRYKPTLRQVLVVMQFSISIVMLIATIVVSRQMDYATHKHLGFNKERVLVLHLEDPCLSSDIKQLRKALLANPQVLSISASQNVPGEPLHNFYHNFETGNEGMQPRLITTMMVDYDYFRLMGIKMLDGSDFDSGMNQYLQTGLFAVLNESAVRELGWKDPVGKTIETGRSEALKKGTCIGVVKDFHVASLHEPIVPTLFRLTNKHFKYLSIRLTNEDVSKAIGFISNTVKGFSPDYPIHYTFLDQSFNAQYVKDEQQNQLFKLFAGLCIFISCLGLMGLTAYSVRQRRKEISIRKIAGAGVWDIVFRLSKDFIKPVFIALVISIPAAYFMMTAWLKSFAYHIEISWDIFLIAGGAGLLIAITTISIHTITAAYKNPAIVLREA